MTKYSLQRYTELRTATNDILDTQAPVKDRAAGFGKILNCLIDQENFPRIIRDHLMRLAIILVKKSEEISVREFGFDMKYFDGMQTEVQALDYEGIVLIAMITKTGDNKYGYKIEINPNNFEIKD